MAIAFRSVAVLATGAARTTSTVNMPASVVSGDEVRISLTAGMNGATAPTITPPGTATLVQSATFGDGSYTVRHSVYRYRATGSPPASFAFTHASATSDGVAVAWSGVDATADDAAATTNSGTGLTATALGLTTVTDDALLVAARGSWQGNAMAPPAGWTERGDQLIQWVGERATTTAGATGNISISAANNSSSEQWSAILMALRPAAVGPPEEGPRNSSALHMMGPSYY